MITSTHETMLEHAVDNLDVRKHTASPSMSCTDNLDYVASVNET